MQSHTGEVVHGITCWPKVGHLTFGQQQEGVEHVVHLREGGGGREGEGEGEGGEGGREGGRRREREGRDSSCIKTDWIRGCTCDDGWWMEVMMVLFCLVASWVLSSSNSWRAVVLSRPEVGS